MTRILAMSAFVLLVSSALAACPSHDEKDPIKITLVVILAGEDGDTVDPRLKAIADEVRKLHPNLTSFKLKHMQSKSVKPNEKVALPCVEKKVVDMVIKH